jgi:enoyl-[acyl-carrier-protein] reductase (NADH)
VVEEIRRDGGIAFSYICDITNEESIAKIGKQIKWDLGDVDILISMIFKVLINSIIKKH